MHYMPYPIAGVPARPVNLIVIHCSATPGGQAVDVRTLDAWHAQRGFARNAGVARVFSPDLPHIGYHFFIGVDGVVRNCRHVDEVGAHAFNFNARSIGICLAGGAERAGRYTPAQWRALAALVNELACHYCIPLAAPTRHYSGPQAYTETDGICGHRDLSPDKDGDGLIEPFEWLKTCPGFDVSHWLKNGLYPASENVLEASHDF